PEWGSEEALAQAPVMLTGHHYPLGCAQTPPPSIEALLSSATRGLAARSLTTYLQVASINKVPLRIDETNTVSCGGVAGISNTFASALWATGYITQGMTAGTVGINLQGNPTNCAGYTPICAPDPTALAEGWFRTQPEWYALLLTRSLVGYRPLPITLSNEGTEGSPDLVAAAFAGPKRSLKVVVSDNDPEDSPPLTLELEVGPKMATAHILRLTAPSESATSGVRLAGRAVAATGAWSAPKHTEAAIPHAGFVTVQLTPGSAALLGVSREQPKRHRHKTKHKDKHKGK
ncbi:MAG: glycosyl hydrolase family 79 C-terminal domain-containing protein, partial [Solirubrobacteraceae bacterium]